MIGAGGLEHIPLAPLPTNQTTNPYAPRLVGSVGCVPFGPPDWLADHGVAQPFAPCSLSETPSPSNTFRRGV